MLKSNVVLVLFVGVGKEILQTCKFISRKSEEFKGYPVSQTYLLQLVKFAMIMTHEIIDDNLWSEFGSTNARNDIKI